MVNNKKEFCRVQKNISLDPFLINEIEGISNETGVPVSRLMDAGMERIIKEYKKTGKVELVAASKNEGRK